MDIIGSPAARRHNATRKIASIAQLAQRVDNKKGVDLDPRPDYVKLSSDSDLALPFEAQMKGTASFENGEVSSMNMTSEHSGYVTNYKVSTDEWEDTRDYEVSTVTPEGDQTFSKATMELAYGYIIAG